MMNEGFVYKQYACYGDCGYLISSTFHYYKLTVRTLKIVINLKEN